MKLGTNDTMIEIPRGRNQNNQPNKCLIDIFKHHFHHYVNMIHICYLLLSSLAQLAYAQFIKMGPCDMYALVLKECENVGMGYYRFYIKTRKVKRDLIVDANITTFIPYDDSVKISASFSQFTNGGWKENFFQKSFDNSCTSAKLYASDLVKKLSKASGLPEGKPTCPIPPGNYTLRNLVLGLKVDVLPMFIYGRYRGDLSYMKNEEIYGCLSITIDVEPKKSKVKG